MRFPPAIIQLRRAQLILMLVVLVPTILISALGVVLLAIGSSSVSIFTGVLVLVFCMTAVTGYILVSIFVGKGASLARVQNDFFSSVSHELRTPLTSIRLLLEPLAEGKLTEAERTQVARLLAREVKRLDSLLVRTLDLSRIQSGRHAFTMASVPVTELVTEAVAAFDAVTATKPTPIALDLEDGAIIHGDRETLVRALVNLLVNAWKYSGDDKQIRVVARASGRRVELDVTDNGIGIDPAERTELFDGFVRGKAALEQQAPGVGLGLAIVKAIVRAHKGKIEVMSEPGRGSTFRLVLPRRAPVPAAASALAIATEPR
ncbi:MAG: two-component sensor histidine kinase [Myxococcales bacterium]|nr:two-component sensor histidine kinase [Myxococcales bacterium]